jgi:hypothetical protein
LNGATRTPRRRSEAQAAVAIQLLPAFDEVPPKKIGVAAMVMLPSQRPAVTVTYVHKAYR